MPANGVSWVKEERHDTCHGSHDGDVSKRNASEQHRLGRGGPDTRPEEVMAEEGIRHRVVWAGHARALEQQRF